MQNPPRALLIAHIPPERVRCYDGSVPTVGDLVMLDQGFTFDDGLPGVLVYCVSSDGITRWSAEVYETEIGDDIRA